MIQPAPEVAGAGVTDTVTENEYKTNPEVLIADNLELSEEYKNLEHCGI